jgi:hypothetical protein
MVVRHPHGGGRSQYLCAPHKEKIVLPIDDLKEGHSCVQAAKGPRVGSVGVVASTGYRQGRSLCITRSPEIERSKINLLFNRPQFAPLPDLDLFFQCARRVLALRSLRSILRPLRSRRASRSQLFGGIFQRYTFETKNSICEQSLIAD